MRGLQCFRNLAADPQSLFDTESARRQPVAQRLAWHQLQHQVAHAIGLLQPMDGSDVGMIQGSHRSRLAPKTCEPLWIERKGLRQDLQGHFPLELRVAGSVNLPHPAYTQHRENLVETNPPSY